MSEVKYSNRHLKKKEDYSSVMGVLIEHRAGENKGVLRKRRRGKILPPPKI